MAPMDPLETILYGLLGLTLLIGPSLVARVKKRANTNSIFLLAIGGAGVALFAPLIGFLIWLAALIWAFTGKKSG